MFEIVAAPTAKLAQQKLHSNFSIIFALSSIDKIILYISLFKNTKLYLA